MVRLNEEFNHYLYSDLFISLKWPENVLTQVRKI